VFAAARGLFCISTPMTDAEVDYACQALEGALELLKPLVAEEAPHLIAG
jgi:hypothetical protein